MAKNSRSASYSKRYIIDKQKCIMSKLFNLKKSITKEQVLLGILSLLCIVMVVGLGEHTPMVPYWHMMAQYTMKLELIFIVAYFVILRTYPPFLEIIKKYKITTSLIFFWFISLLISFIHSPYSLTDHAIAIERLLQSFTHLLFFIFIWDFFKRWTVDYKLLFYAIAFSSLLVAGKFIYDWLYSPWTCIHWLNRPPLNSNIRHTGYQLEAAIGFFLAFLIKKDKDASVNFMIITLLITFLLWTGGRGGIISVYTSFIFMSFAIILHKINLRYFVYTILLSTVIAIGLSQLLAIYDWNGIFNTIHKSVNTQSLNQLSSDRLSIWNNVFALLNENWLFGLGSQGYYFTENRSFNIVQPHNLILQFLTEWGIVGTLIFLTLLVKALWNGIKIHLLNTNGDHRYSLAAGAVLSILLIHSLVGGVFFHPQSSVYLVIAFAIWILPSKQKRLDK